VTSRPPPPTPPGIRIAYQGGSAGTDKIGCELSHRLYRVFREKACYVNFGHCRGIHIKASPLLTTTIYPYHSVRAPFGPFTGVSLLLRLSRGISRISFPPVTLCPLLTPAARWALLAGCSLGSSAAADAFSFVFLSITEVGSSPVRSRYSDDAGGFGGRLPPYRQLHTTAPEMQRTSRGKHTSFGT
jgi:hypothetical protein